MATTTTILINGVNYTEDKSARLRGHGAIVLSGEGHTFTTYRDKDHARVIEALKSGDIDRAEAICASPEVMASKHKHSVNGSAEKRGNRAERVSAEREVLLKKRATVEAMLKDINAQLKKNAADYTEARIDDYLALLESTRRIMAIEEKERAKKNRAEAKKNRAEAKAEAKLNKAIASLVALGLSAEEAEKKAREIANSVA